MAGLGTRFLPATKANAKEMMPVVDKPLIQYAVEEAVSAGIDCIIFITGKSKRAIEDHFDSAPELERQLERKNREDMLKLVRDVLPKGVNCIYLRQQRPLGLGHAVLCAAPVIGDEPFAVLLADDLIDVGNGDNCLDDLIHTYQTYDANVVAVEKVAPEDVEKYGILSGTEVADGIWRVGELKEKPEPAQAPGNLAIIGRYVMKPDIFNILRHTQRDASGEIQLTEAIAQQVEQGSVIAQIHHGKRYDCGNKLGYLSANVELGMCDPEIGKAFREYLRQLEVAD